MRHAMRLSDCTQGDILAVVWMDKTVPAMLGTEVIVMLCSTPKNKGKKNAPPPHHFMVELVDPETMCTYRAGHPALCGRWFNAFAVPDFDVIDIIERRHFGDDGGDGDGDMLDPMRRTA